MDDKWQIIIAECERLSQAAGLPLPGFPQQPAGPVGPEWADPWRREARRLDWLAGYLHEVGVALREADTALKEAGAEPKAPYGQVEKAKRAGR